mgnify:CR=1 FL=1
MRNWQDILAIYVYEQSQEGNTEFTLDSSAKDELAKIFAEMNPVVRDKESITHVSYGNYHINHYIKQNNISQENRTVLKKYVETDCKLLCAIVTDAKGFVRQSVGDDVSEERVNVFIIDDSMFERNRSKKAELLAKVYDHAKHKYLFGFRMLTLGWSDGSSFLPVNSILLSTENRKNCINEATEVDKRTVGYKRRKLSLEKGTQAMLTLLDAAKKAAIPAKYVLFDSWFSSPRTLHAVKSMGYDVIGMVKKTPKMFFRYNGEDMPLTSIYNKNKKRRGRSRYLLSVMIDVVTDGEIIPAKVVYVRNSLSYDAMTAHTAVVFTRYMILSLESRESNDNRSLGELFLYFSDEMSDIT